MTGANDGYWDWDLKTGTVYFSPHYKELLGYTDKAFPDNLAPARAALQKLISGDQEHVEHEFRMRHKDGSLRWILSRGTGQFASV
ncbi:PAS domain-containing protein [uncultured Desulfobacter sp.]|uniref:PAS domain-containing protein n=1 Tax=uncultured Desulfobacter sp. TaxID=240139 RepID=UPI002AAB276F|nr:PAS domain-containing protein [uncultured Desulfobacter sp.]